jgi:hypothetical protein
LILDSNNNRNPFGIANKFLTWFFILSHILGGWVFAGLQSLWIAKKVKESENNIKKHGSLGIILSTMYTIVILLIGVKLLKKTSDK